MILEREKSFKDRSNFDPRGTWGVVTRILNRLIQRIKKNINAFPPFKSPERSYSFSLRRKENLIVQKLNEISENVQYASKCVVRLVITTEHGSLIDETSLKDFLESTYSYPFWYTFDPDNKKLRDYYDVLINSVTGSYNKQNYFLRTLSQSAMSLHALFKNSDKLTKLNHEDARSNASLMLVRGIWNFSEFGLPSLFLSFFKPSIKTKRVLVFNSTHHDEAKFSVKDLEVYLLYDDKLPFSIPDYLRKRYRTNRKATVSSSPLKDFSEENVESRVTSDAPHAIHEAEEFSDEDSILESSFEEQYETNSEKSNETSHHPFNVLLHFHGGGFVAGSPSSHEIYLREWAKQTKALVFTVDYSKAPESKYPVAVNECYYVYKKIVQGKTFNFEPEKIVVAGDSAGANLAMAVTMKAITKNIRVPDGVLLAYAPLDLTKVSTPSRVFFANDVVLPYFFLEVCLSAYLSESDDPRNDYLISPLYAPDEILSKLPDHLVFMCAGYDPLLDDTTRFIQRLDRLGKKYKHYVFDLPHAFWSLGGIHPKAKTIVTYTGNLLSDFFSK